LNYLAALAQDISLLGNAQGAAVADNVARLLAIACGAAIGEHGDAVRAAALGRARQYVQQQLSDPALDPHRAAVALGMSVRQLHALFATTGDSFSKYVQRRRLEACRDALAGPMGQSRSITDIAYAWGFNSLATFYRAFQREFGMAPGDLRARDERLSRTG
jgi:AraC-like DNA-binding protein